MPLGAPLQAMLGSDIGHWDVADMREVVGEAIEHVEAGRMTDDELRRFTFENVVRLHTSANPAFFEGTIVERDVRELLGSAHEQSVAQEAQA